LTKRFFLILISIVLAFHLLGEQGLAQSQSLESLKKELRSGKAFHAELEHLFVDTFTGDSVRSFGKLWIHQNGYRVESDDRIIVVFDSISTVYSFVKNQVIISPYAIQDDDFAPSRFLQADQNEFKINEKKLKNGWQVELISLDDFSVFRQIVLDIENSSLPIRIRAIDQQANINESRFLKARFISFNESLKNINYPANIEIVDLRQ
jgi:hypothetical protein